MGEGGLPTDAGGVRKRKDRPHTNHEQEGLEEGIGCADKALYYGKRHGKNQSVWYKEQ